MIDGDPGTIQAVAWILVIWVIPGIVLLTVAYLFVAWRLRRIGGDGIALAMGARAPRTDDAQEIQLVDVVNELAVAAGIEPPRVLLYDDAPPNALVFGRNPDHATVLVARRLLDDLDREETQGAIARVLASAVDGDLGLAVDVGAVYVTFGLMTTGLAAIVSRVGARSMARRHRSTRRPTARPSRGRDGDRGAARPCWPRTTTRHPMPPSAACRS